MVSGERRYAPQKRIMADLLSQNDLNALLGLTAEHGASRPTEPAEGAAPGAGSGPAAPATGLGPAAPATGLEPAAPATGLGPAAPATGLGPAAPATGLSQGDLDSLLAGLADVTTAARPKGPTPAQQDCAVASGGTLSQEEIDRLLADFGR